VSKATIAIADDHPAMLERIALLLSEKFEIVARVSDGAAALDAVQRFSPDILILDVAMPGMHGIEAARRLRNISSATRVIFLTAGATREELGDYQAFSEGLVIKGRMYSELIPAVEAVLAGGTYFPGPPAERDSPG
jgi:DNA-binding NarL/FixJ family response regulator